MSAVLAALLALAAVANAVSFFDLVKEEWNTYKLTHQKTFSNEIEERYRLKIYADNKNYLVRHNGLYAKGQVTYKLTENRYTDMLLHEFVDVMCGYNKTARQSAYRSALGYPSTNSPDSSVKASRPATFMAPANNVTLPDTVDWRKEGAVTEVKDQGRCGSCWAFSATGALEGQNFRKTGKLVSLSEQNLIDCTTQYGNYGCSGGRMDTAFTYVKENNGIDTEASYTYEGRNGPCRYEEKNKGADDMGHTKIDKGNETMLQNAVAFVGPVSVSIDASAQAFQFYHSGVLNVRGCSTTNLNHGVLVVGYGTDPVGGDYWLVKNSWGADWGNDGYVMMARNRNNHCGIASSASYPLV